jgi:hypothetical protein
MHTGIISFADRIVHNIKTNDTKDMILAQLHALSNIKIIQKHYHKLDENNIRYIKASPHLCCLRSNGNPYYMFFTLYNDVPIIYFIDKKIHPGYQKPRILLVRGLFSETLYHNTLLDGEMVKCRNNKWEFLINDIIAYEGKLLSNTQLPDRLKVLYKMLETQYTADPMIDVCSYKVKTYYHVFKESIPLLLELSTKLNYTCRGIYFWSYDLKYKPKLCNFNEENIINVVRKTKDETKFQQKQTTVSDKTESETIVAQSSKSVHGDIMILWMTQTDYPDVYNLYDNENMLTSNKIGIALIPDLITSKKMRNAFKNKNAATILKAKCSYNNVFNKWYPVDIIF